MLLLCYRCRTDKEETEFARSRAKPHRRDRDGYCRGCQVDYRRELIAGKRGQGLCSATTCKRQALPNSGYCRRCLDYSRKFSKTVKGRYRTYLHGAAVRGYEFALSFQAFEHLILGPCSYCGAMADPTNGIDRVDNSKGYVPDNVVTACEVCNQAKHKLSRAAFLAWVSRVYNHSVAS